MYEIIIFVWFAFPCVTGSGTNAPIDFELPFEYKNDVGNFQMKWGFLNETITIEFTLPSDTWIGLGIDCPDGSARCDMIVGNADGNGEKPFIYDTYEPHGDRQSIEDTSLGGTDDLTLLDASYSTEEGTTLKFSRKTDTGDKYDGKIKPGNMDLVYAWCAPPFCDSIETAHAPGDWNIISVDLHYHRQERHSNLRLGASTEADCTPGSTDLCTCSQLLHRGAILSFDDCTQEAAIAYCEGNGGLC